MSGAVLAIVRSFPVRTGPWASLRSRFLRCLLIITPATSKSITRTTTTDDMVPAAVEAEALSEAASISGTKIDGESLGARLGVSVGDRVGLVVGDRVGITVGLAVGAALGIRVGEAVGHEVPLPTTCVAASSYPAKKTVQSKHAVATNAAWSIGSTKETRTTTEPCDTEMKSGAVGLPMASATLWMKTTSNAEISPTGNSVLKSTSYDMTMGLIVTSVGLLVGLVVGVDDVGLWVGDNDGEDVGTDKVGDKEGEVVGSMS